MRQTVLLVLLAFTLTAGAQKMMTINLSSGEAVTYDRAEVDSIVFAFEETDIYRGHGQVDLGLPSGLRWATCNIGAEAPEEYGNYYAWAETEPRERFGNENRYVVNFKLTKYNTDETLGKVDNITTLEPDDDVAHVLWGGPWRMPTNEEFTELTENCRCTTVTENSVKGCQFEGPNGNTIFLPFTGFALGGPISSGSLAYYWSSSLDTDSELGSCKNAYVLPIGNGSDYYVNFRQRRETGCAVRAVATAYATAAGTQEAMKVYMSNGRVDAYEITGVDSITFKAPYENDEYNGYAYVDLGLPSGLKWAAYNIGASAPEESGGYYEWGETEVTDHSMSSNKHISNNKTVLKYNVNPSQGDVDNKTVLEPEDDVAHMVWGGRWRMPTDEETKELQECCIWEETTLNGVSVTKITGPSGKSICLPHSGYYSGSNLFDGGTVGCFWSATLCSGGYAKDYCSYSFAFKAPYAVSNLRRTCGASVRAVAE